MQMVRILGVVGSPRKNGNTKKLMEKALEGASNIPDVQTELYEMAGKDYHYCLGCYKCFNTGACVFKDDLQGFLTSYYKADGIIWGAPVYHMGVPASMKAVLDRLGCSNLGYWRRLGRGKPRFCKVCGVLTVGASRYGGQEFVLNFLIQSSLLMTGVVVAGDTTLGTYIGTAGSTWLSPPEKLTLEKRSESKDIISHDEITIRSAIKLGQTVAEMTKIVRAGITELRNELPDEYFYEWKEE